MLKSNPQKYHYKIVSVVGSMEYINGNAVTLKCAGSGSLKVYVDPDFQFMQGSIVDVIGAVTTEDEMQCFVFRELGSEFDLDLYNDFIMKIQPKFPEYFIPDCERV